MRFLMRVSLRRVEDGPVIDPFADRVSAEDAPGKQNR